MKETKATIVDDKTGRYKCPYCKRVSILKNGNEKDKK